jgi:hypothetical protein
LPFPFFRRLFFLYLPASFVLGGNTNRTCVQVALLHHNTTRCNQRSSRESGLFSTQQASDRNIPTSLQLTVSLELDKVAKTIENQSLLSLCKTQFPWKTATLDSCSSGSTCTTALSTDKDVAGKRLNRKIAEITSSKMASTNTRSALPWQHHQRQLQNIMWLGIL